jgi:hypothetical protein
MHGWMDGWMKEGRRKGRKEGVSIVHWWNDTEKGNELVRETLVQVSLCPQQMAHRLAWY